jgi:DNA mismatch repair protein MutL
VSPSRIELLPEHLIDQIKAGEVIERPANVLKELLENAIDAGSSQIDVEIVDNGLSLLRVSDNGRGIPSDQIELAFGRHATSKIKRFEDLYRLDTFGFRGEALPAIASISRLECASWTSPQAGAMLRIDGGRPASVFHAGDQGRSHGTVMTVRDLFFNTPVRLKFLQSAVAEKNWLKRFFYAFVLAHPEIGFSIQWDEGEKLLYPAAPGITERVRQLFSGKAVIETQEALAEWQGLSCHIVTVTETTHRSDGPLEHVLINGRPVLDKTFTRLMQQLWEKHVASPFPRVLLLLRLPGDHVDVNVHPNKTVVKFHQNHEVLALVTATWRKLLPQTHSPQTPSPAVQTEFDPAPTHDLARDRSASYTQHMQDLWQDSPLAPEPISPEGLSEVGPYFLWQSTGQHWYVHGRELLKTWVQIQMQGPAESTPLLVSHPLKSLTESQQKMWSQAGFEIDELEPGYWVLRALPVWAQGIPLEILVATVRGDQLAPFAFTELSPGKWQDIWNSCPPEARWAVGLTPALFK